MKRQIYRVSDIGAALAACKLAAQGYQDELYRTGYLAACDVMAAAFGVEELPAPAVDVTWRYLEVEDEVQP